MRHVLTPNALELKTLLESYTNSVAGGSAACGYNRGGGVLSHPVGMAVHDDGTYNRGLLQPGHVFSIDPQLRVPEENLYIRYEELDEMEKLVGTGGVVQKAPPVPLSAIPSKR